MVLMVKMEYRDREMVTEKCRNTVTESCGKHSQAKIRAKKKNDEGRRVTCSIRS